MHQLEVTFTGAVLDLKLELEGMEVGLYFDGVSEWTRTLKEFKIDDKLDVFMVCKGINGTAWSFEITIDHQPPKTYTGEISKGYSLLSEAIELPPKK